MTLFNGLSAFPLTPTDDEGRVDAEVLARFLERIHHAGADSIGLLGSTGGYAYLTKEERKRTVAVAVECIGGRTPLMVGVGALRTDDAQALARDAKAAGADGLLLAPMSYVPLNEDEVFQHFVAVAEAGELPLCIYNNPSTTRFTFSDALIARLSAVSNVAAVKMPLAAGGDYAGELARLRQVTPDRLTIGYSGDWGAADALLAGCDTWYSVAAGLLPGPGACADACCAGRRRCRGRAVEQGLRTALDLVQAPRQLPRHVRHCGPSWIWRTSSRRVRSCPCRRTPKMTSGWHWISSRSRAGRRF
jgi:4-hydroxy-tetrahydrodipicolinate synthase